MYYTCKTMATRTVRLDEESEQLLSELQAATGGESVSKLLKRGLRALREELRAEVAQRPYEVYEQLDLGPGGYGRAPARESKAALREILRRKHGR